MGLHGGATRRNEARAFALPLVILVALAAFLALGLVLTRHGTSHLAVERQISTYRNHHSHMGVQEIVDRWLATTRGAVRERLGDGGLAFELELPQGVRIRVFLEDAQGAALEDLRVLHGPETRYARVMLRMLDQLPDANTDEGRARIFRAHGPAKLSAHTVRPEVLYAMAQAVAPQGKWEDFARNLLVRRENKELASSDIRAIANESGLNGPELSGMEMMLTTEPTIWKATVQVIGGGRREQAEGLIEVPPDQVNASMGRVSRFLSWKDLAN